MMLRNTLAPHIIHELSKGIKADEEGSTGRQTSVTQQMYDSKPFLHSHIHPYTPRDLLTHRHHFLSTLLLFGAMFLA